MRYGVCVLKVRNAIIIICRFDKWHLTWDPLKLPSPGQSYSHHHHPVQLMSTLLTLLGSLEIPIRSTSKKSTSKTTKKEASSRRSQDKSVREGLKGSAEIGMCWSCPSCPYDAFCTAAPASRKRPWSGSRHRAELEILGTGTNCE